MHRCQRSRTRPPSPRPPRRSPEEISHALARGAGGLSPRSKRLLAAALELSPAATAAARRLRMRRAGFWGKVRVAVRAATLAAYLYARRANEWYAPLPPT